VEQTPSGGCRHGATPSRGWCPREPGRVGGGARHGTTDARPVMRSRRLPPVLTTSGANPAQRPCQRQQAANGVDWTGHDGQPTAARTRMIIHRGDPLARSRTKWGASPEGGWEKEKKNKHYTTTTLPSTGRDVDASRNVVIHFKNRGPASSPSTQSRPSPLCECHTFPNNAARLPALVTSHVCSASKTKAPQFKLPVACGPVCTSVQRTTPPRKRANKGRLSGTSVCRQRNSSNSHVRTDAATCSWLQKPTAESNIKSWHRWSLPRLTAGASGRRRPVTTPVLAPSRCKSFSRPGKPQRTAMIQCCPVTIGRKTVSILNGDVLAVLRQLVEWKASDGSDAHRASVAGRTPPPTPERSAE